MDYGNIVSIFIGGLIPVGIAIYQINKTFKNQKELEKEIFTRTNRIENLERIIKPCLKAQKLIGNASNIKTMIECNINFEPTKNPYYQEYAELSDSLFQITQEILINSYLYEPFDEKDDSFFEIFELKNITKEISKQTASISHEVILYGFTDLKKSYKILIDMKENVERLMIYSNYFIEFNIFLLKSNIDKKDIAERLEKFKGEKTRIEKVFETRRE